MQGLTSDLRFAVRALVARPGFAALAVLTLAIGIGVNAVAFSAIDTVLSKPTTIPGYQTLGWIGVRPPGNTYGLVSWPDYRDIARASRSFESIVASGRMPVGLHEGNTVRQIWAQVVSANYFATLRARPAIGRLFAEADVARPDVPVVVSQRFWRDSLGNGGSVAGRTLTLNRRETVIVGVLPDDFQGPGGFFEPDVWLPLDGMELVNLPARLGERREGWLGLVGRLAPGVTPVQARAELQAVVARLPVEDTGAKTDRTVVFTPMTDGNPELQSLAPAAYLALGIVSIVLLIACFNVAGLLLARAAERQREISVRSALGAGRWRIVRQFALEGLILATVSGCAAVIVAGWSADLLSVFSLPSPIPQRLHIAIEPRLVGFTAAMVALAGILPALVPAFHATRIDLVRSMRVDTSFGERRSRMRSLFVVAQVAGSTLFIATAVLFLRSFWTTASRDPGFETAHLLVMELKPTDHGYDRPRARLFLDTFVQRLRAHPAVEHAAIADRVSFYVGFPKTTKVSADGTNCAAAPAECRSVFVYGIGTDYFPAVGVPLRSGRELTPREIQVGEGAIVSRAMAERLWPQRNAVGEWIREGNEGRQIQIVGVAADVVHHSFGETAREYLYRPLRDDEYGDGVTIVVRTINDARASVSTIQEILRAVDPNIPPRAIKTMAQRMELPLWPIRTGAAFFLICGTLALILATVGLFGTTYLTVSQRTREFGIRAALGATRLRVLRLVVGEGLRLTLPGIALGLGGTIVVARLFARSFFQLESADPAAYAAAGALQTAVAMAACLLPAYRATKTDPMAALRVD